MMSLDPVTLLMSVALVITTMLVVKYGAKRRRYVAMVERIPGPPALPIIGNALDLMIPRNRLMAMVDKRAREYAPIFRTWGGPEAHIHLTKAEHVEAVLSSTKHISKATMYRFLHPWLGQSLVTSTGSRWRSKRKMITPTFHFKILETFFDVFLEKAQILVEKFAKENSLKGEEGFDIYPFVSRCALDIICETAMGTEIRAQEETHSEYVEAVADITQLTLLRFFRPWLHMDFIFYRTELGRKYTSCLKVLHGFTNKVIQEKKAEKIAMGRNEEMNDEVLIMGSKKRLAFMDLLLEAALVENLSDEDVRGEVDTFMFAGHDTTTAGITWALYLIGGHPHVQEKVLAELDAIYEDTDRPIALRDLSEMKYLECVIKESLRLYPSVPFIMRNVEEDTKCGEYFIPAGSMINIHIYHVHRDPDYYSLPEEFNPDHFLPENAQGRHPYAYIPFSAGPRNCVGQKYAMMEQKTIIAAVLRRFRVRALEDRAELTLINELILRPESGIRLVLTPR